MNKKARSSIPRSIAARVLFEADRTCCVCRISAKPVQLHHIDEDPTNHDAGNLAVLCLDCHRDTQIRGGFDRKLDGDQVTLYRDDWNRIVAQQRAMHRLGSDRTESTDVDIALETSIAEIYRENGQYEMLAMHYHHLGNAELRDKYIDVVLESDPGDSTIVFLRKMQGRADLIHPDVIERQEEAYAEHDDWLQRARLRDSIGRHRDAVLDYLKGIQRTLGNGNVFSAAYYLQELSRSGLIRELFTQALDKARAEESLWWQVRALQELGWHTELDALLLEHADEIDNSDELLLLELLEQARNDPQAYGDVRKAIAAGERMR